MVESDTSCINILTQVSAATRALQALALELWEDHVNHCGADVITSGGSETGTRPPARHLAVKIYRQTALKIATRAKKARHYHLRGGLDTR